MSNGSIFRVGGGRVLNAKVLIEHWRKKYNAAQPHNSLRHKPPEFIECATILKI
jgi:hypothetical protein